MYIVSKYLRGNLIHETTPQMIVQCQQILQLFYMYVRFRHV